MTGARTSVRPGRRSLPKRLRRQGPETSADPIRVGFVVHVMQVAGAEVLVSETIRRLGPRIVPTVFCLDRLGPLGEGFLAEGVPVVVLGRQPGLDLAVAWRMSRELRRRRIEVLHTHQYTPFFYGALAACGMRPRAKVVFTEHGRHFPDHVTAKRRVINRIFMDSLASEVNAVCEFSARSLSEQDGFARARIRVIQNGVDLRKYESNTDAGTLRDRLQLDPLRRYVACVARFHPVKDHRTLIKAFVAVAGQRPDVDLLLVGDGDLRAELEQLVQLAGIKERVRFMGVRGDVADILRAVDVFTLTSISEAASITLLEAMASSLPVVVTAVGGSPEIVRDGIDGLLVPRGDSSAVMSALLRLLDEPAVARRLGASGAARVRERYRLEDTIEEYYRLYSDLANRRHAN